MDSKQEIDMELQENNTEVKEKVETLFGSGIDFSTYENWELTKDYDRDSYAERLEYDSVNHDYSSDDESGDE